MQQLINLEVLEDGNLRISLTPEGKVSLEDMLNEDGHINYYQAWDDLMGWWHGNSEYRRTDSSECGGLTDSPMIADGMYYEDDGKPAFHPDWKLWWFPDYQVVDEFEVMLRDGFVVFTKAD